MIKHALFVRLEAKPGKEKELAQFLQAGLGMAQQEGTTPVWFALQLSPSTFGIFDAFFDEAGRQAHLNGPIAQALGAKVKRLSIRDQSSRWGSCTSAGSLSFSWRLILAPPYVLDYLAAHEVAHLVEMNHSARFWRVVGKVCGHVERAKTWLDTHGNDLHRYGVED